MSRSLTPIGKEISRRRKLKGWTQEELAEKSGCKLRSIQKAESQKQDPLSPNLLVDIAHSLGCELADIVELPAEYCLGHLPVPFDDRLFVGRRELITQLDRIWRSDDIHFLQLFGEGGNGKSTVVWHWLNSLLCREFDGAKRAMDWCFHAPSCDSHAFFRIAMDYFNVQTHTQQDLHARARAIANSFRNSGGLLILDGIESVTSESEIAEFLNALRHPPTSAEPRRLLILTTRSELTELRGPGLHAIPVDLLSPKDGGDLLRDFRLLNDEESRLYFSVPTPNTGQDEYAIAAEEFGCHPLTLVLLASYSLRACKGDLSQRFTISGLPAPGGPASEQARQIMSRYVTFFKSQTTEADQACRELLLVLGLFSSRVAMSRINLLSRSTPRIPQITELISDIRKYELARSELKRLRLIYETVDGFFDTHPLVHKYFEDEVHAAIPESAREAHRRLFEALKTSSDFSDAREALMHGCKAGLDQDAFDDVYLKTIRGVGKSNMPAHQSVVPGLLLTVLPYFFKTCWNEWHDASEPGLQVLSDEAKMLILNDVAMCFLYNASFVHPQAAVALEQAGEALRVADAMAGPTGRNRQNLRALYQQWNRDLAMGELTKAKLAAITMVNMANDLGDKDLCAAARSAVGGTLMYLGQIRDALDHLLIAEKIYNDNQDLPLSVLQMHDPAVACFAYAALARALANQLPLARKCIKQTIDFAREKHHPYSLCLALHIGAIIFRWTGDSAEGHAVCCELMHVAEENRFSIWLAAAMGDLGSLKVLDGDCNTGIKKLEEGYQQWCKSVPRLVGTHWKAMLAEAYLANGRGVEAKKAIDSAYKQMWETKERYFAAELIRLRAQHHLATNTSPSVATAAALLQKASRLAVKQGANLFSVRADRALELLEPTNLEKTGDE